MHLLPIVRRVRERRKGPKWKTVWVCHLLSGAACEQRARAPFLEPWGTSTRGPRLASFPILFPYFMHSVGDDSQKLMFLGWWFLPSWVSAFGCRHKSSHSRAVSKAGIEESCSVECIGQSYIAACCYRLHFHISGFHLYVLSNFILAQGRKWLLGLFKLWQKHIQDFSL